MARREFQTMDEVADWLTEVGIDATRWGRGESKGLADLWLEYKSGEATFRDDPPTRLIEVAEIIIRRGDAILIEVEQEFIDGRRRARLVPPSEKLKLGEDPRAAALRCLREELGLTAEQMVMGEEMDRTEAVADSPSYPGLSTRYLFHTFEATADSLPNEDFYRENTAPDDPIRRHRWGWRSGI
jgi:hypothetical protein